MGIGADLKQAREAAGITLDAVSDKTKINVIYLEAIEKEDWGIFPSHTFAKGFLRAYAKVVKVDPVEATRQFNEGVSPHPVSIVPPSIEEIPDTPSWKSLTSRKKAPPPASTPAAPAAPSAAIPSSPAEFLYAPAPAPSAKTPAHPPARDLALEFDEDSTDERQAVARMLFNRRPSNSFSYRRWAGIALNGLGLLLLVVVLAYGIRSVFRWTAHHRSAPAPQAEAPTVNPTPVNLVRRLIPAAPVKPAPAAAKPKPVKPVPASVKPVPAAASAQAPSGAVPQRDETQAVVPAASPSAAQAAAQAVAPVDKYHHLIFKGLEPAWLLVVVDGHARTQLTLQPGQTKAFQAVHGFSVKIGNASGIDAQFDGQSLGVLGGHGKVVNLVLPQHYQPPIEP